jgi:hypothetical protein
MSSDWLVLGRPTRPDVSGPVPLLLPLPLLGLFVNSCCGARAPLMARLLLLLFVLTEWVRR